MSKPHAYITHNANNLNIPFMSLFRSVNRYEQFGDSGWKEPVGLWPATKVSPIHVLHKFPQTRAESSEEEAAAAGRILPKPPDL